MTVNFDSSVLLGWFQAKANLASAQLAGASGSRATAASAAKVPTAPWNARGGVPADSALVTAALAGRPFVDERAAKVNVANADADYKKLFAINQGLVALQALANAANDPKTPSFKLASIQSAFDRGMAEISKYVEATKFDNFRLTSGTVLSGQTSSAGAAKVVDGYVTAALATGSADTAVASFAGNVQFDAVVTTAAATASQPAKTVSVHFDLAEMGATPRSMNAVAKYMADKLQAAGAGVRVSVDKNPVPAQTVTVNGKPVTITAEQTELAFSFSGLSTQAITFSAAATNPAVYVAQTAGSTDPNGDGKTDDADQQQELVKFEAGTGVDAARRPGDTNYAAGRVFSQKLPDGVSNVHATATGADGSVYLIADATAAVDGQGIKGAQDAVLLKYDAAGQLVYTQTLGAGVNASGLALAASADGKVAIAGSVTGQMDGDTGADAKTSDSFVTVFDAKGDELWTQRQGATGADEAQAVAFDGSGNVYVAGRAQGTIGGQAAVGGYDGYLRAYNAAGVSQGTRQFGSASDDSVSGLVVNGSTVYVASQDGGSGVIRSFDATDPKQMTLTASRNLGSLGGGAIGAIGLDGSGNLLVGGATGAALTVGNTTIARGGGVDGFGARISSDLTSTASDAVAYYGGTGTDRATAATIAGGQVWLTGTSKTDLPGLTAVGKQDGFVAALDVGAGAVTYSQRFTAKDQTDAPETIAVDMTGGSPLDLLGLPKGTLGLAAPPGGVAPDVNTTALLTTSTSLRAGDQFQLKVGTGSPVTITIAADETLATLKSKIQRASLFEADVTTIGGDGIQKLSIKPENDRYTFELLAGPDGKDALAALGLKPGLMRNTTVDKKTKSVIPADHGKQAYGLRFSTRLDLANKADIKAALDGVGNAITQVRAIYADLKQAATPKSAQAQAGNAPAYMQTRIADYQAALNRLTAGQSSDGSGSSLASLIG